MDKRASKRGEEAPLKIGINKDGSSAYISLGIKLYPTQWDTKKERIKDHPNKNAIQSYVDTQKTKVVNLIMEMATKGLLRGLTATQIKNKVKERLEPSAAPADSFYNRFLAYANSRHAQRTREIYLTTAKQMVEYDKQIKSKAFNDIKKDWLNGFDEYLRLRDVAVNSRAIHFRNIRAVFNDALDNEITTNYPFRVFKIRTEATRKRSLTITQMKTLFHLQVEAKYQMALDMFKLSFLLIGVNISDLCYLERIENGRINYRRKKTGKLYSVKVEEEALEIINKYKGMKYLLNLLEKRKNVHTFTIYMDKCLKAIFPECQITSYWARHTWATLASEIGITEDVISHALGHSFSTGASVTQVYINFNTSKIDDANRQVIDFVLA